MSQTKVLEQIRWSRRWHARPWRDPTCLHDPFLVLIGFGVLASVAFLLGVSVVGHAEVLFLPGALVVAQLMARLRDVLRKWDAVPESANTVDGCRVTCRGHASELAQVAARLLEPARAPICVRRVYPAAAPFYWLLLIVAVGLGHKWVGLPRELAAWACVASAVGWAAYAIPRVQQYEVRDGALCIQTPALFGPARTRVWPLRHAEIDCDFCEGVLRIRADGRDVEIGLEGIPYAHRLCAAVVGSAVQRPS